jgi:hypothetical protein
METIEQFTQEHYKSFMRIYNHCNLKDKVMLTVLRSINIIIVFMVLAGCFAPKKFLVWHLLLCFIVFISLEFSDFDVINSYTYKILKRNNIDNLDDNKLIKASELLPLRNSTIKSTLVIVGLISLLGYIHHNFLANNVIKNVNNKLENALCDEEANYDIMTEFKLSKNKIPNKSKYTLTTDGKFNGKQIIDVPIYNELQFNAPQTEININSSLIDLNEDGLSIFNKIKPINIETTKVKPMSKIIESDINVDLTKLDKNKILKSLELFNA